MGQQAMKAQLYHAAVVLFAHLSRYLKRKNQFKSVHYLNLWNVTITYDEVKHLLTSAIATHDHKLIKRGPYGDIHRCNEVAFRAKTRSFKNPSGPPILGRKMQNKYHQYLLENDTLGNAGKYYMAESMQSERLCKGEQIQVI